MMVGVQPDGIGSLDDGGAVVSGALVAETEITVAEAVIAELVIRVEEGTVDEYIVFMVEPLAETSVMLSEALEKVSIVDKIDIVVGELLAKLDKVLGEAVAGTSKDKEAEPLTEGRSADVDGIELELVVLMDMAVTKLEADAGIAGIELATLVDDTIASATEVCEDEELELGKAIDEDKVLKLTTGFDEGVAAEVLELALTEVTRLDVEANVCVPRECARAVMDVAPRLTASELEILDASGAIANSPMDSPALAWRLIRRRGTTPIRGQVITSLNAGDVLLDAE
jgi:hypothetical protein